MEILFLIALAALAARLAGDDVGTDHGGDPVSVPHLPRAALPAPHSDFTGWIQPVPRWIDRRGRARLPVVSSGYLSPGSKREHHGQDIMFRRLPGDPPADGIHGSKGYVMPDGIHALAAGPGRVWSAGETHTPDGLSRGMGVIIDHGELVPGSGRAYATFYNHGRAGSLLVSKGQRVVAGQRLFEIHGAPHQGTHALKHLHFELRLGLTRFNAEPYLGTWRTQDEAGP